jgi:predicted lysophospholipase L1 biosynthesis ABC-type transport system permease subunit
VRTRLTERARIITPATLSPAPVLTPTLAMFAMGVAVTVVLAVLGFAAVAASTGQARRTELAPLRTLGLSAGRIRRGRANEKAVSAVLAIVLGAAAGLLTAVLVVPGLVGVLS